MVADMKFKPTWVGAGGGGGGDPLRACFIMYIHMHILTECSFLTIKIVPYFQITHICTTLPTFILLYIQSIIVGNIKVRTFICFGLMHFLYDSTHSIFLMHTHS